MILCRFNSKIRINIKEERSRRVKAGMETDDLPSIAYPLRARESRTVKRVLFSRVFSGCRICLNVGIRNINAKWRPDSGVHGIRLAEKKPSGLRDSAKIKDGVMGSEDRIRYPQVISS